MALKRDVTYPGRFATPTAGHPQGAFVNRVLPGSGSFLEQAWANDWDGFFSSLLDANGGVVPNGSVDEVGASQYFDQLVALIASSSTLKTGDFTTSTDPDILTRGFLELKAPGIVNDVNRVTYADLFADMGTDFGIGDGASTFGLPPKKNAVLTGVGVSSAWVQLGTYTADTSSTGDVSALTVNPSNGDVWVCDGLGAGGEIYKLTGGAGTYTATNNYLVVGNRPFGITVNKSNGDVWVVDSSAALAVFKSAGGSVDFVDSGLWSFGTVGSILDIEVNPLNGDVWLVTSLGLTGLYWSEGGTTSFVEMTGYPGTEPISVSINEVTGLVAVYDRQDDRLYAFQSPSENYYEINAAAVPNGSGVTINSVTDDIIISRTSGGLIERLNDAVFNVVGAPTFTNPIDLDVDSVTGDIYCCDSVTNEIFKIDGSPATKWYIKI